MTAYDAPAIPGMPPAPESPASIAALLAQHPRALAASHASIDRQQAKAAAMIAPSPACPHCGSEGTPRTVAGRVYKIRSSRCCQRAATDDAIAQLRYMFNPNGQPAQQREAAALYAELRALVTDPDLSDLIESEAANLRQIGQRVTAGGAMCQTAYSQAAQPETLKIAYDHSAEQYTEPLN